MNGVMVDSSGKKETCLRYFESYIKLMSHESGVLCQKLKSIAWPLVRLSQNIKFSVQKEEMPGHIQSGQQA